nr:hypothetical protein [Prevotella jejuni]
MIGKIFGLEERLVIWEGSLCLRYFTNLTRITFNNVGSTHDTSDRLRIIKKV